MSLFPNAFRAVAVFTAVLHLRRKRTWLIAALLASPALLPPVFARFGPPELSGDLKAFDAVAQYFYSVFLASLTALVYGCSLLSEEIEGRTLPLLLSRPVPRSAIVLGKYAAFCGISSALLAGSLALTYGGFVLFLDVPVQDSLRLLVGWMFVSAIALAAYGAFCLAVSTITRRPVVVSALFIFGWEGLVIALPGYADFITVSKYVRRIAPEVTWKRLEIEKVELPPELLREVYEVGYGQSMVALGIIVGVFLTIACLMVRSREFSAAVDSA